MPYTLPPTTRRTTVPSSLTEMCFTACVQTCDCAAFFELHGGEVRDYLRSGYRKQSTAWSLTMPVACMKA